MTDTTETTTFTMESPDVSITKTEVIDVDFLRQLISCPDVSHEDKTRLKKINKLLRKGNQLEVTYKLGDRGKVGFLGRWNALHGLSLQGLRRDLRNALGGGHYIDVDMKNAQPSILLGYCLKKGWKCDSLRKYVENREEMLANVMEYRNCDRSTAKDIVTAVIFSSTQNTNLPDFFKNELHTEMRAIQSAIWKMYSATTLKFLEKQPNRYGSGLAFILQSEERKCLMALEKALMTRGRRMDTYIHDGGLVYSPDENETEFPIAFLEQLEKDIKNDTGYDIKLACKEMDTTWEREEIQSQNENDYAEMKAEFEKEYFSLNDSPMYIRICPDGHLQQLTKGDVIHQKGHLKLKCGDNFLIRWFADEKRTYEKLGYCPKGNVPDNEFNIWTKFEIDARAGADIQPIHNLLRSLCNNEEKTYRFVERWVAHIFQKPYMKTETAIVIQGNEGCGKDTFWEFIGKILGEHYFFTTAHPENNVFHNFNWGSQNCVLVKFEEANFDTNKANCEGLKAMLVDAKSKYTKKGQDQVTLPDFRNVVMTTNNEIPVVLGDLDRRYMLIKASDENIGNFQYWNELYKHINDVNVQAAYHQYLLDMDLTGFDPRVRHITDYYKEVKMGLAPYHANWFYDFIMSARIARQALEIPEAKNVTTTKWAIHELCKLVGNGLLHPPKQNKFSRDLKGYVESGAIVKTLENRLVYVELFPDLCMAYMRKKMWIPEEN